MRGPELTHNKILYGDFAIQVSGCYRGGGNTIPDLSNLSHFSEDKYGKCPKISNTLKFRTPNIFARNNSWKCPKISNSSSFARRGFLKFRTQLSSAHSNFSNIFFSVTELETKVAVLKATAKHKCTQRCHNGILFT